MATKTKSVSEFEEILKNCGNGLLVVHFSATWAPQCQQMNEVIQELAKEYVHVKFMQDTVDAPEDKAHSTFTFFQEPALFSLFILKKVHSRNRKFAISEVEAEELVPISEKYNVASVPTILFFKNEKEIDRLGGANAPELTKKVLHHSSTFVPPLSTNDQSSCKESINDKLKRIINSSSNMLFMKGTPEKPRCGFSKQTVEILSGYKFGSFDILTDDEVRQGLKAYSNWPTYPQFYVNGELVGGFDIIKELAESGELETMLAESKEDDVNTRIHKLINSSKIMLFMKGSPQQPRCGFSRQMCQILQNYPSVEYSSFDVLLDQEVRQGIKEYSNWPTFPQLYVNGEFIGGLDIAKELHESGELESELSAEQT